MFGYPILAAYAKKYVGFSRRIPPIELGSAARWYYRLAAFVSAPQNRGRFIFVYRLD
jgi:hypothetical protein